MAHRHVGHATPTSNRPAREASRRSALALVHAAVVSVVLLAGTLASAPRAQSLPEQANARPTNAVSAMVPRFERPANPIALRGPARPFAFLEASGRRAAFLGREDGTFEAWAYPLKIAHDVSLAFGTPAYADPVPGASLAAAVDVRPEGVTVRYAHAAFTVDATWLVPLEAFGGLVLLDVDTSVPLTIVVKLRPDLKPMWPAALGGQYSYWDGDLRAHVVGEASRKHAAIIGSPLADAPPEQPAHNLPDAPLQFTIRLTPEQARAGLVPVAVVATAGGLDRARDAYTDLLRDPAAAWHTSATHYARLRDTFASIDSPDNGLDLALEWGKVALDKGFVCNPDLGCGLIAGLGPSGTTERPGFGWFFGGDTFMNAWAMTAYGDMETVRRSLAFLQKHQRADGKMPHEISQGAGYVRWFEDFPYAYYHADTTPLYIAAVADWARASGDLSAAREFWPSIQKAFEYCLSTDEDGDGLMDNTKAGLAAVETGSLRSRDVLTDVYLAAVWTDATRAAAWLAAALGDASFDARARASHDRARAALDRRFAGSPEGIPFAVMRDGSLQGASTVWPSVGLWRGVFDENRPAVQRTLDLLAGHGIAADWGARMVTRDSPLYDPLSYNNGAVWPFVTGFTTLALYRNGRPDAGFAYLDALGALAFVEARGYTAELFSGDRLRSVDAAVPHQLFATAGFVSGLLRGLLGFDAASTSKAGRPDEVLALRPVLPPAWPRFEARNLQWRGHRVDVTLERSGLEHLVRVSATPGPLPVEVTLPLPPGARPAAIVLKGTATASGVTWRRTLERPGLVLVPRHEPLALGESSSRLRIVRTVFEGERFVARVAGRRGQPYPADAFGLPDRAVVTGARVVARGRRGAPARVEVTVPAGAGEWGEADVLISGFGAKGPATAPSAP